MADGDATTTQPARPVTPTPPPLAGPGTYAPSPLPAFTAPQISKAIISNESGGENKVSPQGARGPGQIMPATFRQYARPGENINNPADNLAVHNRIIADYTSRWPNDPARVAVAYFSGPGNVSPPGSPTPWIRNVSDINESVAKYVANVEGKIGAPSTAAPAAPAAPANVGGALAALNAPTGQSGLKSTMDNLQGMAGGQDQTQPPPPMDMQNQQAAAAMGNARQAQIAAIAPQLMAATRAQSGLRGPQIAPSSMSFMGGQLIPMPGATPTPGNAPPPGTTLNSTGGLYG